MVRLGLIISLIALIGVLIASSIYLVSSRLPMLRSQHRLEALLSRESIFLANNLVLVGLCFVIFWGTYFPLISEALTGSESAVGPPWFDRYTVPLALVLVLLSGVGPLLAWRRASRPCGLAYGRQVCQERAASADRGTRCGPGDRQRAVGDRRTRRTRRADHRRPP